MRRLTGLLVAGLLLLTISTPYQLAHAQARLWNPLGEFGVRYAKAFKSSAQVELFLDRVHPNASLVTQKIYVGRRYDEVYVVARVVSSTATQEGVLMSIFNYSPISIKATIGWWATKTSSGESVQLYEMSPSTTRLMADIAVDGQGTVLPGGRVYERTGWVDKSGQNQEALGRQTIAQLNADFDSLLEADTAPAPTPEVGLAQRPIPGSMTQCFIDCSSVLAIPIATGSAIGIVCGAIIVTTGPAVPLGLAACVIYAAIVTVGLFLGCLLGSLPCNDWFVFEYRRYVPRAYGKGGCYA